MRRSVIALAVALSFPAFAVATETPAALGHTPATLSSVHDGINAARMAMASNAEPESRTTAGAMAVRLLTEPAARGDANAAWHLGYLYATGLGVKRDSARGEALVLASANAGNTVAAYWLGRRLLDTGANKSEGIRLLTLASVDGHAGARQTLGWQDPDGGHATANARAQSSGVDTSTPEHSSKPVIGASQVATRVVQPTTAVDVAALRGALVTAQARISELEAEVMQLRRGVTQQAVDGEALNRDALDAIRQGDYETAIAKLRKAANLGDAAAIANLAALYLNGLSVPQDTQQAMALFERAALAGNRTAAENLGTLYEFGILHPRNPSRAIQWYRRAADLGSVVALPALRRLGAPE